MPDLIIEDEGSPTFGAPKIAIGVSKGRSGLGLLKWVLENEVPLHGLVYLIHVESRLRWIPNALGSKFPIEQVHPEMAKSYKVHRYMETQKLLDQYRRLCDKKKIQSRVCYSESDSVQKELVSQIIKFGITRLVLGVSSQSVLSRALKKDNISTYVAKNSPGFCSVMVVKKGKLCFVKNATPTPTVYGSSLSSEDNSRMSIVSETITGSDVASEDDSRTWSGVSNDISNSQRASDDHSQNSSQWTLSYGTSNNGACHSLPIGVVIRDLPDNNTALLNEMCELQSTLSTEASLSENKLLDSIDMAHEVGSIYEASERRQDPDSYTLGVMATSTITGRVIPQALLLNENCLPGPSLAASNIEVSTGAQVEFLQNQLIKAQVCSKRARTEADWQGRKVEVVLARAKKKVMEHERHRVQALRKAKCAIKQATKDAIRCGEALSALEVATRDHDEIKRRLDEEVIRHQETQMGLAVQKEMVDAYAHEAACAKDYAEAERRRCEETVKKLEVMARRVEEEGQLRREAEEIASQENIEKLAALAALGKKQQNYSEYSFKELQSATGDFNEVNKLGEGRYGCVYKGKLHHTTVAIKVLAQNRPHSCQEFQREVELLSCIRHPHMLMLLGACLERGCMVHEYMENGSLEDRLNCKDGTPPLPWYTRFRICLEVATALLFLHSQPKPIVHRNLNPANILLDHHFVSKIGDVGVLPHNFSFNVTFYKDSVLVGRSAYIDPDFQRTGVESCECDVYALGIVMLQLLTGRPAVGVTDLVEEAERNGKLVKILDISAGNWPLEEAKKLARISLECTTSRRARAKLEVDVLPVLEIIQAVAGVAAANMACIRAAFSSTRPVIPSFFICPILQEVMEKPCFAADGYTYEHCAIKVWLQTNNTSPMTNLRLDHKTLTPNYSLRSAIKEWYDNGLI